VGGCSPRGGCREGRRVLPEEEGDALSELGSLSLQAREGLWVKNCSLVVKRLIGCRHW